MSPNVLVQRVVVVPHWPTSRLDKNSLNTTRSRSPLPGPGTPHPGSGIFELQCIETYTRWTDKIPKISLAFVVVVVVVTCMSSRHI